MTKKQHEELVEQALKDQALVEKREKDAMTLVTYEQRLRGTKKHYTKSAEAYSTGGQKGRALAVGGCVLKLLEQLPKDAAEKHFLPGTLSWIIQVEHVKDTDGKKGYRYIVAYHAYADEQAISDEEIRVEIEDLQKKLDAETAEMFGLEMPAEEPAEEDSWASPGGCDQEDTQAIAEVKDTSIQ